MLLRFRRFAQELFLGNYGARSNLWPSSQVLERHTCPGDGYAGWTVPLICRTAYPGGMGGHRRRSQHRIESIFLSRLRSFAVAQDNRTATGNLSGKAKFRPSMMRIFLRRVPEFAAPTLLDSDMQNSRSRPGWTTGSGLRQARYCRWCVRLWGVAGVLRSSC